jgi:hypothetical protein
MGIQITDETLSSFHLPEEKLIIAKKVKTQEIQKKI